MIVNCIIKLIVFLNRCVDEANVTNWSNASLKLSLQHLLIGVTTIFFIGVTTFFIGVSVTMRKRCREFIEETAKINWNAFSAVLFLCPYGVSLGDIVCGEDRLRDVTADAVQYTHRPGGPSRTDFETSWVCLEIGVPLKLNMIKNL